MVQITRLQTRCLRGILRKSVPIGYSRNFRPPLAFHANEEGLRIRFDYGEVAGEWHLTEPRPRETIHLPGKALDDFEGGQSTDVTLAIQGKDIVLAHWQDAGVPQTRDYAIPAAPSNSFPEEPKQYKEMDIGLLLALDDAAQTAALEPGRQALTRVQLRGKRGEIASTDSKVLLLQRGFPFPWQEDVLVPAIGVFNCKELAPPDLVGIGRNESHVCVRLGAWRFFLKIDQHARFPRIEQAIPSKFTMGTTIHVAPDDARFLSEKLPHLPGAANEYEDITVDVNGRVALRAKDEGRGQATELILNRSQASGPAATFVSNRQFLGRALRLGFTDFHIARPNVPIVARDRRRLFVWVPLNPDDAIPSSPNVKRIESATDSQSVPQEPQPSRRTKPMPAPTTNNHVTNGNQPNGDRSERSPALAELIAEAEELRTVLADASTRLARLLSGLKASRRQSRAVQAAVHSLKQLQLDG